MALQRFKVKERGRVVLLVLVLDFPPLVLQVQNSSALGMVEGRGSIEGAQDKGQEDDTGHRLQAQSAKQINKRRPSVNFGCRLSRDPLKERLIFIKLYLQPIE